MPIVIFTIFNHLLAVSVLHCSMTLFSASTICQFIIIKLTIFQRDVICIKVLVTIVIHITSRNSKHFAVNNKYLMLCGVEIKLGLIDSLTPGEVKNFKESLWKEKYYCSSSVNIYDSIFTSLVICVR